LGEPLPQVGNREEPAASGSILHHAVVQKPVVESCSINCTYNTMYIQLT
jgi:hypothetical protein